MAKWHEFFLKKLLERPLYVNTNVPKQMTLGYILLTCDMCLQIPLPPMPLGI
jgi:hypothetical protein